VNKYHDSHAISLSPAKSNFEEDGPLVAVVLSGRLPGKFQNIGGYGFLLLEESLASYMPVSLSRKLSDNAAFLNI
jgi:hypothetical protein